MKTSFNFTYMLLCALCYGCNSGNNETYLPSIASLTLNESLVLKYKACHRSCVTETIEFRNDIAIIGVNSLSLTADEISTLDDYFLQGTVMDEGKCSKIIQINFRHEKGPKLLNSKETGFYPCSKSQTISPTALMVHFSEMLDEVPYWRMTKHERDEFIRRGVK